MSRPERSEPTSLASGLKADEAFVAFEVSEPNSYAWIMTKNELRFVTLPGRNHLAELTERAFDRLRRQGGPNEAVLELSDVLLGRLLNDPTLKTLFVSPDEFLHSIPFAALRNPMVPSEPLIVKHSVTRVPNLRWLTVGARVGKTRLDRIFAMGDALYRPTAESATPFDSLKPLPWTRLELDTIGILFGKERFHAARQEQASRDTFLQTKFSDYDVLHFATHAVADMRFPELSGLVLSTRDATGESMQALVNAREIARLEIPVDLVVLSACDTGRGRTLSGEGPLSLAWAFLAGGARQVVNSLWAVPDKSTSRLMEKFYSYLLRGEEPADALRLAQLDLMQSPASRIPYYWAAFVVTGI